MQSSMVDTARSYVLLVLFRYWHSEKGVLHGVYWEFVEAAPRTMALQIARDSKASLGRCLLCGAASSVRGGDEFFF